MSQLNKIDQENCEKLDLALKEVKKRIEHLSSFKLNEIYVLETTWNKSLNKEIQKGHMGLPNKYKVVRITPEGLPCLRKLSANGHPTGDILFPFIEDYLWPVVEHQQDTWSAVDEFIPDPEQLDAILLQQEFNPTQAHNDRLKLFNEVNKHNKRITIKTGWNDRDKITTFFNSLNPGDKFWTSTEKFFIFRSLEKSGREWKITATNQEQKEVHTNINYWCHRRLYKEMPRSFAKESKI